MAKRKLNYRIHNPNSVEATADYILKVFIEVNEGKVEKAIQEVAEELPEKENGIMGYSQVDVDGLQFRLNPRK